VERLTFYSLEVLQKVEERKFEVGPTLKTFPPCFERKLWRSTNFL